MNRTEKQRLTDVARLIDRVKASLGKVSEENLLRLETFLELFLEEGEHPLSPEELAEIERESERALEAVRGPDGKLDPRKGISHSEAMRRLFPRAAKAAP